jgi:hypothetical protein
LICMEPARVLLVANRTAADFALVEAVRVRGLGRRVAFHLVVPATPRGLHRVVDPEVTGRTAAAERLRSALPLLSEAAGSEVTGHVGDANPLAAVSDALNLQGFDEIIISTLPWRLSRWLRIDLPSKIRGLGVPVHHVTSSQTGRVEAGLAEVAQHRPGPIQASAGSSSADAAPLSAQSAGVRGGGQSAWRTADWPIAAPTRRC